jgi:DNA (cytosine-5)-methyltransferase 1
MKAIDLYSGVGGWTLGLKMAGVEVVDSFEWWGEANATHSANFNKEIPCRDIRKLDFSTLPAPGTIDFVVGSPPCTQFSFANRGGNGDIDDGLVDVYQFLSVVAYIKPRYWAFENVPRVSQILAKEIASGGRLAQFSGLVKVNEVFDMSDFGLPQKRKRAIIGDFPVALLRAYAAKTVPMTLGDAIAALDAEPVVDPNYGITISPNQLNDHIKEQPLSFEEERLNRESKSYHPVFNRMQFPDAMDRPARTVTALCTRVSRESIIVPNGKQYRRLTVRERAVLQSFPITYQFFGRSHESKVKMIGNAIPPLMTFYIAQAMQETAFESVRFPHQATYLHAMPSTLAVSAQPSEKGRSFSPNRKFKAAIPGLRFGSGMRFELENFHLDYLVGWRVNFFFGNSKDIRSVDLTGVLLEEAMAVFRREEQVELSRLLTPITAKMAGLSPELLQAAWTHRQVATHPYEICDALGTVASTIVSRLELYPATDLWEFLENKVVAGNRHHLALAELPGKRKLQSFSVQILAGMIVGSWTNKIFSLNSPVLLV